MNQRIMLTKRLLRESLLKILEHKTIERVSITELCEDAGINRSTFYTHYNTVGDVMLEIEKEITGHVKEIYSSERHSIRGRIEKICEYLYRMKDIELILFRNHTDNDLSTVFVTLNADLKQSRDEIGTEKDEELILAFINYGMFYLVKTWLQNDIPMTPKEITDLLFDRVLRFK